MKNNKVIVERLIPPPFPRANVRRQYEYKCTHHLIFGGEGALPPRRGTEEKEQEASAPSETVHTPPFKRV